MPDQESRRRVAADRPRLLHLLSTTQRRGAELFAIRLARRLEAGSFENLLCAVRSSEGQESHTAAEGLNLVALNNRQRARSLLPGSVKTALRLRQTLKAYQPDLVIGHGSDTLKYVALSRFFYPSARTVYLNIGMASHWATSWRKVRANRFLLRRIDRVVSVSSATKSDFQRHYSYPADRVVFIANGVEPEAFGRARLSGLRDQARRELGLTAKDVAVVTVGSLTPEKNQAELPSMLAAVRSQGLNGKLLIAGSGPLRNDLEEQAVALGVNDSVRFLGSVADVPRLLAASDVFVLPSKTEGMPGVLIEAGLAGLPSVAYDVGGVREVVEDGVTGVIVPPGNSSGFTEAVARLVRSPEMRSSMGLRAHERCARLFDMEKVTGEYEALFLELIDGAAKASASSERAVSAIADKSGRAG